MQEGPLLIEERLVARINELARKKKTLGLTPDEQQEQALLRKKYLEAFRSSFRNQLDHIHFSDDEANGHQH